MEDSYTIKQIEKDNYKLFSIKECLSNIEVIKLNNDLLKKVKNGMILDSFFDGEMALLIDSNEKEIAIYIKDENRKVKPYKMIEVNI